MKNKLLIFIFCAMLANFSTGTRLNAKTSGNAGEGKLEDVVVKEKDAFKIEKEKPTVTLSVDQMKAVQPTIKTEKYFLEGQADKPETDDLNLPFDLTAKGSIAPWLCSVLSEPVVEFVFDGQKTEHGYWKLIIADSRGKQFNVYANKNPVPPSINWDGRDKSGNFMLAGMPYSYIFEVTDKKGNKKSVIGKPIVVNAVAHQENYDLFINLSLKALFEKKKNGLDISREGSLLLKETSDIIKEYFDSNLIVRVRSENKEHANDQAKVIRSYLVDALLMPEKQVSIESFGSAPETYQVEIVIVSGERTGWEYKNVMHNKLIVTVETPESEPSKSGVPASTPEPAGNR